MKSAIQIMCALVLGISFIGCGKRVETVPEPLVAGEPASQYYSYFHYSENGSQCIGAAPLPMKRAELVDGKTSVGGGEAHLYLEIHPRGLALIRYKELDEKRVETTLVANVRKWKIDGATLLIDGFGRGNGELVGGEKIIRFELEANSIAKEFKGSVDFSKVGGPCGVF